MIDLVSSITSSTIATMLLYPAQRLKIEMQLNKQSNQFMTNFINIYSKYGSKGFYQGLTPLVIGNGLAYGIYFVAYEKLKSILHTNSQSLISIVQCSGLAGCAGSIATNPFFVIQTRQSKQNKSFISILKELIENEGVKSLWKGLLASLILVSNPIIQFVCYEWLKKILTKQKKVLNNLVVFLIGAISKIIATIFTYPYTLLRTRQQIKSDNNTQSLMNIFKQIVHNQGYLGIFKGLSPKLIQTTLNSALILMIYERIRLILNKKFK